MTVKFEGQDRREATLKKFYLNMVSKTWKKLANYAYQKALM